MRGKRKTSDTICLLRAYQHPNCSFRPSTICFTLVSLNRLSRHLSGSTSAVQSSQIGRRAPSMTTSPSDV